MIAIIQARMSSTRFPGKVLQDIGGKPMLWHVMNRLSKSPLITQMCVALPLDEKDGEINMWMCTLRYNEFSKPFCWDAAGEMDDVLTRYYELAAQLKALYVVRITSDCPLIDPVIVTDTLTYYLQNGFGYVHNCGTFPSGFDVQVCSFKLLEVVHKEAIDPYDREHVFTYVEKHPEKFKIGEYKYKENLRNVKLSVDTPGELRCVKEIMEKRGSECTFEEIMDAIL